MPTPAGTIVTRREFGIGALAVSAAPLAASASATTIPTTDDRYRPQIHYAPPKGFMNDPNGLVYAGSEYHLFYQFNPGANVAGNVRWGHAVSKDLLNWRTLPEAVPVTARGMAFSGSAVIDAHNSSGLFDDRPGGGMVAIFTRASDTAQVQDLASSTDGGRHFTMFAGNPVLAVGSTSFRDPKLLWHAATQRWVMAVVRAREHHVIFYASADLKVWREVGRFDNAGLLGIDYECPDLVELPVEGGGMRWVLFVSINPGAPQGGSAVQYFVGDFDGSRFVPDDAVTRLADFGQDFYALQTYSGVVGTPVAIAWMSNWLYTNDVPFSRSRGAMTLPRLLSLRRRGNDWRLLQNPISLDSIAARTLVKGSVATKVGTPIDIPIPPGSAVELTGTIDAKPGAVVRIVFTNGSGEKLVAGFETGNYPGFFLDRGGARGFDHRHFVNRFAWAAPSETHRADLRLILDRTSLELIGLGGEASGTILHYFEHAPDRMQIVVDGAPAALSDFHVRALHPIASATEMAISS